MVAEELVYFNIAGLCGP